MSAGDWLLEATERGNPDSALPAWSTGNLATPLVHGATYFGDLLGRVERMRSGDLLLFTDWRGDPDEQLVDGISVSTAFCAAAARGVVVRGLVWRSHLDKLAFSAAENRHLGEDIEAAGGQCLLDTRVRIGGSHHQKLVVLRHPGRPERDVAFVGGIDLCHSRRDDAEHLGDAQRQPMSAAYGPRPPWHDVMLALTGPAVADVETVFRERWEDPRPPTRNPVRRLADLLRHEDDRARALPPPLPLPATTGPHTVQLLRTYPRRLGGYPFARQGERSVARGYSKALERARRLIYVEDQYLWSEQVADAFAQALAERPELHVVAVLPHHPDQDGRFSLPPNVVGRDRAVSTMRSAGGDRVGLYGVENAVGTPVYVHAKVCVVDDVWATVGSDNVNRRSWTHDSELTAAVLDETRDPREPRDPAGLGDGARTYARALRLTLMREHLGQDSDEGLLDPACAVRRVRDSAAALQAWHDDPTGPRPPGRLRPVTTEPLSAWTRWWATRLYQRVYDPDGRPRSLRRAGTF